MDALPFEDVEHNPEQALPSDHVPLLASLLRYGAEVLTALCDTDHPLNDAPKGTEIDHGYTAAFENAVGLLHHHGLARALLAEGPFYCLTVPIKAFPNVMAQRHRDGQLSFDDFNRALEAPLHLARQTDVRASRGVIREVIEGLRDLGLVEGPDGKSVWTEKILLYVWFSAYGQAVEGAEYSGANDFERFLAEAHA